MFFGIARDITERVRQETAIERLNLELEQRVVERTKQLREVTDLLQAVMDSAKDAIFLKDTAGRFMLFNRAAERFSGHSAAEVIGKTAVDVFGPVEGGMMMAQEHEVFARGETTTVEETLTMKGVQRVFLATRSLRRNASGEVVGLVGVSRDITDRKIAENELRAQRERLILAAQVGGFGVWDYHIDTDTLYCDERWYQIVGRDPSNPIRSVQEFKPFIHPEDVRHATEVNLVSLAELLACQHDYSNLFRIIRPDGAIRWLRSTACLIEGGSSLPARAVGIVSDVTESRLAEEKLRRSYQSLLEAERLARIGSWRLELRTGQFTCSEMLYEMNGADPAGPPLTPTDIGRLFTAEGSRAVKLAMECCARTGESFELNVRHLKLNGNAFASQVRGEANRDPTGAIVAVSGTVQDVTEREEARARLASLADNLPSGAICVLENDETGIPVVSYVSAGIETLIGVPASTLISEPESLPNIIISEDRARCHDVWRHAVATLTVFDCRFRARTTDGRNIWMHIRAAPRQQADGSPVWEGIIRDITPEHEAAEALRNAKEAAEAAERTKSDFLATMSHEIRTPMSTVIGLTRLALNTELSEKQRGYLERIDYSAKRLLAIINDILDISKLEAGHLALEDITFKLDSMLDSVTHICGLRAQEKGLELIYSIGADVPRLLRGDPLRLSQVLTNLVSNAIKFTAHGEIRVSIELLPGGGTHTRTIQFSVRDTGIGLDAEQLSRLFRPFAQADADTARRYGGTGLGLVICKRIVERMAGQIWAEGRPGRGSTFRFKVTLRDEREATATLPTQIDPAAAPASAKTWPILAGRRVLVVDDNAFNRDIAVELLALAGMNVDTAGNGAEAIALVGRTPYDAILMDIQMPDMDGMEAARRLRQNPANPPPPIIALTARTRVEDYDASRKAGMWAHLTKPIEDTLLYRTLTDVLGGAGNPYNTGTQPAAPAPGEAHAADDTPLDFSRVLQRVRGDEARLERLLLGFRRDFTDAPQRLEAIDAAGNLPEIAMLAHAVKGAAGYLSASRLVSVTADLESAARAGDREQVGKLGPVLAQELSSVLREIDGRLPRRTPFPAMPLDRRTAIELVTRIEPLVARGDHRAEELLGDLATAVGAGELAPVVEELRVQYEDLELVAASATLSRLGALLQEPAS